MASETINVFIIYAKEDQERKKRLLDHLSPFVCAYDITLWHDEYIEPGKEWNKEIKFKLEQTDIFILLVSVDFFNSQYILQVELKAAIDRHRLNKSRVIPVIIGHCQWDLKLQFGDNFSLANLQVLPLEAKPLDDWPTPDKFYNEITSEIRKLLEIIRAERTVPITDEKIIHKIEIEAGFPGGENAWREYLRKNLKPDVPVDLGADEGIYNIVVKFVINKEGDISDVMAENNPGYGISEEVIRVIKNSPKWTPAMQNGNRVNAYRRQPVTFKIENNDFNNPLKRFGKGVNDIFNR